MKFFCWTTLQTSSFVKIIILRQRAQSGRRVPGPGRPDSEIGSFWNHFRPDRALATQTVKFVHFGTIFDQIEPWPPRRWNLSVLVPFSTRSGPGRPDGEVGPFWYTPNDQFNRTCLRENSQGSLLFFRRIVAQNCNVIQGLIRDPVHRLHLTRFSFKIVLSFEFGAHVFSRTWFLSSGLALGYLRPQKSAVL